MGQADSSRKALPSLWRSQPASGTPEAPDRGLRGTIRRTRVRVNLGLTVELVALRQTKIDRGRVGPPSEVLPALRKARPLGGGGSSEAPDQGKLGSILVEREFASILVQQRHQQALDKNERFLYSYLGIEKPPSPSTRSFVRTSAAARKRRASSSRKTGETVAFCP